MKRLAEVVNPFCMNVALIFKIGPTGGAVTTKLLVVLAEAGCAVNVAPVVGGKSATTPFMNVTSKVYWVTLLGATVLGPRITELCGT